MNNLLFEPAHEMVVSIALPGGKVSGDKIHTLLSAKSDSDVTFLLKTYQEQNQ